MKNNSRELIKGEYCYSNKKELTELRDGLLNDITPMYHRVQLFLEKSRSQKGEKKITALQDTLSKLEKEIKNI